MASTFATQLRTIAQNSTHELDLRARRTVHAESLLFPKETAAKQDFEAIYAICFQGFRELCALDPALVEFGENLFNTQSIRMEREQMSHRENRILDKVLERALLVLSSKLLLAPGVRCLEWLVRRFRVHIYNASAMLLAVLPWHEMRVWRNVLSIVPKEKCTAEWKFLGTYKEEALNLPRRTVVNAMTNNDRFFTMMNRHVIDAASVGAAYAGLVKFWTSVVAEATLARLDAARSGRREIQKQKTEDLSTNIISVLSDGFGVHDCPDLTLACFTLSMLLAGRAELEDHVLDALLETTAKAAQYPETDKRTAVVTMIVLVCQKQAKVVPKPALDALITVSNLDDMLLNLREAYPIGLFIEILVNSALLGLKRRYIPTRLTFVTKLLQFCSQSLLQTTAVAAALAILERIDALKSNDEVENMFREGLIEVLQRSNENPKLSLAIVSASQKLGQNPSQLGAMLGSTVVVTDAGSEVITDDAVVNANVSASTDIEQLLKMVPSRTVNTSSFLGKYDRQLMDELARCFVACCKSCAALKKFSSLPIWESSSPCRTLYNSLLLRIAVGPFTSLQKSTALRLLIESLEDVKQPTDFQAFLPYVLTALSDFAQSVRKSAADLLITIEKASPAEDNTAEKFGIQDLYHNTSNQHIKWIATNHFKSIVGQALLPALDECVLDASHAAIAVQVALNSLDKVNQTSSISNHAELKRSLRHDFFELLASHAVYTPLLKVKVNTIRLMEHVSKVGTSTKTKALAPVLETWISLDNATALKAADEEQMPLQEIDAAMLGIIHPSDKDFIGQVLNLLAEKDTDSRADFVAVFFEHVTRIWKDLKHEAQVSNAQNIFELAFQSKSALAKGAQRVLRSVKLTTDILGSILEQSESSVTQMQDEGMPPKKKRRTSHGRESLPPDLAIVVTTASSRLTLALELLDDAHPETRPELLPVLFDILSMLKRLKQQQRLNLPYLQNICLSNILAIVDAQRLLSKPTIDMSSIRADLVTDCIRSSENPQVQNTALLLSSNLASIAPDQVLHNVMPIFTFMSQKILSKHDEHSVYVINQAIDKIIPALVETLRSQDKDLIKTTSGLLASFTAAFDHIPQHRKVAIYARLLGRIGAQDFAFIVFALLAQKKFYNSSFDRFFSDLLAELDAETLLITARKSIGLASDVLSSKAEIAGDIFGFHEPTNTDKRLQLSVVVLKTTLQVLRSPELKSQASKLHKVGVDSAERLRSEFYACFRLILSMIRKHRQDGSNVVDEAKQCLDALLALPSLIELFVILPQALTNEEVDEDLKPQSLQVLADQLQKAPARDNKTRIAAMDLLSKLAEMLQGPLDLTLTQAIIVCIDRLSEVYGRKDINTVVSAANVIAGNYCLGSSDRRIKVMSLLALASMLEVLQEACTPIIPEMTERTVDILRNVVQDESQDEELHNAAFSLTAAVVSHVPFLISDESLQALLVLSSLSAVKFTSPSAKESRVETLSIVARKVNMTPLLATLLDEDLHVARQHPENAELEKLDMLLAVIETCSKADIVRNADVISQLLLSHLDQRSRLLSAGDAVDEHLVKAVERIEIKINLMSIQFIYKLNDTAFRPIFESWVDWATNAHDIEEPALRETMKTLRRTSMFHLLTNFFETLKSIVTSYASYVIPVANDILTEAVTIADSKKTNQISIDTKLYAALTTMLRITFTHDADGFYSTPSHFEPLALPLISQLKLAVSKGVRSFIYSDTIPTIVSLAAATQDTPAHHQTLSHRLVQLRHSPAAAVRLASIKTFAALTADEDVGDEFLANVIGIGSVEGEGPRGGGGRVGEVMIYVNEMLEDDNEEVEREVRKWVQLVREKSGEDVFEV